MYAVIIVMIIIRNENYFGLKSNPNTIPALTHTHAHTHIDTQNARHILR